MTSCEMFAIAGWSVAASLLIANIVYTAIGIVTDGKHLNIPMPGEREHISED